MSETKVAVLPIVNMNGTSKEELLFQYRAIMAFTKAALSAACEARPHGRDYQCNREPDAAQTARFDYETKVVARLAAVADYLEALLIGINDQ